MTEAAIGRQSRQHSGTLRGVLVILATGIALGVGFNALGQLGTPRKGLAWVGEEKRLETLPASEQAAGDLPAIPDVGRPLQTDLAGARKFFDAKAALFIDAREGDEFSEGHIPGSMSLPFDQSVTDPAALERIDSGGKPIIVYCGGGACELSMNLAFALVQSGHSKVLVYMGGFPEWAAAGLPVAKGAGS